MLNFLRVLGRFNNYKVMRTFVIGDIHGAYKALVQLMERIPVSKGDTLIFLGDYVDGWSESPQVIDHLMRLQNDYNCIFIRGNHDVKCYEWLQNNTVIGDWLLHGGGATQDAYAKVSDAKIARHLKFITDLQDYYIDSENRLFVHAGFTSAKGVEKESYAPNFCWDRTLWECAYALDPSLAITDKRYPVRLKLYNEIYIGHTATTRYEEILPIQGGNLWNLDTGAAFYGKLTGMDVDSKMFFQSDVVMDLYPGESGRN